MECSLAVADLCEVLSHAAVRALPFGVYNCTSKTPLQTLEVVRIVAEALGVEPAITHVNDRLVHDRCYAMDPVKLQAYGWKAVVDPVDAIAAAAVEMKFAGNSGEVLTSSWS